MNMISPRGKVATLRVVRASEPRADGVRRLSTLEEAEQYWVRECGYARVPEWMRLALECQDRIDIVPVEVEKLLQRNP